MSGEDVQGDDLLALMGGVRLLTDAPGEKNARRATAAGAALLGDGRLDGLRVLPCGHIGKPTDLCCSRHFGRQDGGSDG